MILDFDIEIHVFYFAHTNLCLESIMMITFVFFFLPFKLGVPAKKLVMGRLFILVFGKMSLLSIPVCINQVPLQTE